MTDRNALIKLAKGRALATRKTPYFCTDYLSLVPYEAPEAGTILVTKTLILAYNPEYINQQTDDQVAGLYFHELSHVLRRHMDRLADADPYLRNLAGDICINDDGKTMGFVFPNNGIYSTTFGFPPGLSMEQYYELLVKKQQEKNQVRVGPGVPGQDRHQPEQYAFPPRGPCAGECGGVGGNSPNQDLEDKLNKLERLGRSDLDVKRVQKQAAHDLKTHIESAKGRGSVPANMLEDILANLAPTKIPWTRLLGSVLVNTFERITSGHEEYTFRRISPRTYTRDDGLIRPGCITFEPEIILCLDTSASMGTAQIAKSFRASIDLMQALGISELMFLEADTKLATEPKRVRIHDLKDMKIHGRGGTDFRPAIAHAKKMTPKADALVYFTDGDGFAPEAPPRGLEVIWCVVPSYCKKAPAPWGKTIFVEE